MKQTIGFKESRISQEHYFLWRKKRATSSIEKIKDKVKLLNKRVLDIGCGYGSLSSLLLDGGASVWATEVDRKKMKFAVGKLGLNDKFTPKLVENEMLPFDRDFFDVIFIFDVIEHVRNPLDFMARVNSLLRKSGKAYIVTPSLDSWSAKLLGRNWMEYKIEHLSYFNRKAITLLLEKSGFHNIKFYSNYKVLNFDYINRHFVRFPVKGMSPLMNLVRKITPDKLAYMPVKVIASGMAVIAEKREN